MLLQHEEGKLMHRLLLTFGIAFVLGYPEQVDAYHIERVADGHYEITCNDGTTILHHGNGDTAIDAANEFCEDHGGIANVSDDDIENALDTLESCGLPSSIVVAQPLGGGMYDALTAADVDTLLSGVPFGSSVELPGYQVVGLVINGTELIQSPDPSLPSLPVLEVFSDTEATGQVAVSGGTLPAVCTVPLGSISLVALIVAFILLGTWQVLAFRQRAL
jgi:hypothetical protein